MDLSTLDRLRAWNEQMRLTPSQAKELDWKQLDQAVAGSFPKSQLSSTNKRSNALKSVSSTHFLVAVISGRRYAIRADRVKEIGKIRNTCWMRGKVRTSDGSETILKDAKKLLNLEGESGNFFVLIHSGGRSIAWAFDAIEGIVSAPDMRVRPLPQFGRGNAKNHVVEGTLQWKNREQTTWVLRLW